MNYYCPLRRIWNQKSIMFSSVWLLGGVPSDKAALGSVSCLARGVPGLEPKRSRSVPDLYHTAPSHLSHLTWHLLLSTSMRRINQDKLMTRAKFRSDNWSKGYFALSWCIIRGLYGRDNFVPLWPMAVVQVSRKGNPTRRWPKIQSIGQSKAWEDFGNSRSDGEKGEVGF